MPLAGLRLTMSRLEPMLLLDPEVPAVLPRTQVWDCMSQAETLAATFEVHEAAIAHGFMPEEATTLSLVLAELSMRAVKRAKGAVASVFFSPEGWRLEVALATAGSSSAPWCLSDSALLRSLTSVRVHEVPGAGTVLLAEHRRDANA